MKMALASETEILRRRFRKQDKIKRSYYMNIQTIYTIKNKLTALIISSALLFTFGIFFSDNVQAVNVIKDNQSGVFKEATDQDIRKTDTIKNITNILLYMLGIIAVVPIIIGGMKYVLANGDASKIKSSKDIIMYAVIGLIVAIMAWGIVSFVVDRF